MFVIRSQFGKSYLYWNDAQFKWVSYNYSTYPTQAKAMAMSNTIRGGNHFEIIEEVNNGTN